METKDKKEDISSQSISLGSIFLSWNEVEMKCTKVAVSPFARASSHRTFCCTVFLITEDVTSNS